MFKIGDIVEFVGKSWKQHHYKYAEVRSLTGRYLVGVCCKYPNLNIATGTESNWGQSQFKKIENPESLPCYKYILLHGHSPE